MDPVSTTIIAVNIVALTFRIASLVRLMKGLQDFEQPGVDHIQAGLLTEFTRFKSWCRQMGITEADDLNNLRSKLPPDASQSVVVLMKLFKKWMTRSKLQLEKYGIAYNINDPLMTFEKSEGLKNMRKKFKRFQWRLDGYKDLNEMLRTLQALNECLQAVCKPKLSYSEARVERLLDLVESLVRRENTLEQFTTRASNSESLNRELSGLLTESEEDVAYRRASPITPQLMRLPEEFFQSTEPSQASIQAEATELKQKIRQSADSFPTEQIFLVILEMLAKCVVTFEDSKMRTAAKRLKAGRERLKIWGCSAFVVPMHLDQIFDQSRPREAALKSCIIGILVDLFMVLEFCLETLAEAGYPNVQQTLFRSQLVYSIHYKLFEEFLDAPEDQYETSADMGAFVSELAEEVLGSIDSLFHTLSPLRRQQEIRFLELETTVPNVISNLEAQRIVLEPEAAENISEAAQPVEFTPLEALLETTDEMMTAMEISLIEADRARMEEKKDKEQLEAAVKEINEWQEQHNRLKAWSKTFQKLSKELDDPDAVESKIKICQSLASMATNVARALPQSADVQIPIAGIVPQIQNLDLMFSPSANTPRFGRDLKLVGESKSLADARDVVKAANKVIEDEFGKFGTRLPTPRHSVPGTRIINY